MDAAQIQQEIDSGELTRISVAELRPWDDNPRRNRAAAESLAKAVQAIGWGAPIVVQARSRRVIAGHTRLQAAKKIGLESLPAYVIDVDDRRATQIALADNRLGELAAWDLTGLAEQLATFTVDDADVMGFDQAYLDDLSKKVEGFGPLSDMPPLPDGEQGDMHTMTFTLHKDQITVVKQALERAGNAGPYEQGINSNRNGNALARVCETYVHGR